MKEKQVAHTQKVFLSLKANTVFTAEISEDLQGKVLQSL